MLFTHLYAFDVISLTETWDQKSKKHEFLPGSIEGYEYFNGLSGQSHKSGCGFYIKDSITNINRTGLDSYEYDNTFEFGAKWIEIINKNKKNFIIASVYRHPYKNETAFLDYLQKTLQKIKKENKTVIITGDFKYNLLNSGNDSNIDMFLELMYITYSSHISFTRPELWIMRNPH